ncbi:hypothetical protein ERJ75_000132100 [Trypanosoma vivax]|nr:hypothetical protein ERJ75_000132100 [Trypanosoma vivax]
MRRFFDLTKRGAGCRSAARPFSLRVWALSKAAAHKGTVADDGEREGAGSAFPFGPSERGSGECRRAGAASDAPGPVCAALGSEKGRAAARLARAAACRWCEIGLLPRESFAEHSGDRNALIVGRALRQKRSRQTRAEQRAAVARKVAEKWRPGAGQSAWRARGG